MVHLVPLVDGLSQPVLVTHGGDGSGRLFIVEQSGKVSVWRGSSLLSTPFLDLSDRVVSGGERGLLGLAFHPQYQQNGRFFVNYTRLAGNQLQTVVAEYLVSASNPDTADRDEKVLLEIDQPYNNHNGGMMAFGPDGYLYIATGDGGSSGDPSGNGQDLASLLGKFLRIDIDRGEPYEIPPNNPFVGQAGARPEIWAYGLRNPWRFSFDRITGRLFAGDVGQGAWEEIDVVSRGGNYGWNLLEGTHCYPPGSDCSSVGTILPVSEYGRSDGRSVTGGYVYRGPEAAGPWADYLFGDYSSGTIWKLSEGRGGTWKRTELLRTDLQISSFGEDEAGRLHLLDYRRGGLYRLDFSWRQVFAHAGDGSFAVGRFLSRIILVNRGEERVSGLVRFLDQDGSQAAVSIEGEKTFEHSFAIEPDGSATLETDADTDPAFVGWVEVVADAPFAGQLLFVLEQQDEVAEAGVASSAVADSFVSHVTRQATMGLEPALALANPSDDVSCDATATLIDEGGKTVLEVTLEIGPRQQKALYVSQLGEMPEDFSGTIRIEGTHPVAGTLLTTQRGIHSASLPLVP
jgi:glucose/arabinose dehydrogenase